MSAAIKSCTKLIISGALHPPTLPTTNLCLNNTNKGLELFRVASDTVEYDYILLTTLECIDSINFKGILNVAALV